jgi:hypothetical protein
MASTWVLLTLTVTLLGLAVGAVVTPSSDTDGMALADLAAELRVLRGEVAALRASHGECSTLCMHATASMHVHVDLCLHGWLAMHRVLARVLHTHTHVAHAASHRCSAAHRCVPCVCTRVLV